MTLLISSFSKLLVSISLLGKYFLLKSYLSCP